LIRLKAPLARDVTIDVPACADDITDGPEAA
jgi:hypothetical protein